MNAVLQMVHTAAKIDYTDHYVALYMRASNVQNLITMLTIHALVPAAQSVEYCLSYAHDRSASYLDSIKNELEAEQNNALVLSVTF